MAWTRALLLGVKEGGGGVRGCSSCVVLGHPGPFLTSSAPHAWDWDPSGFREADRMGGGRGRWCGCLSCLGPCPQQ